MRTVLNRGLVLALCAMNLAVACGDDTAGDQRPLVVVSTTILGDVVSDLAGEAARVEVLMPAGVDPHEYSASASAAALLRDADLVVVNGLGLESGLADALSALPAAVTVLAVGPAVGPITYPGGVPDPHFWFDPTRMSTAVGVIVDALVSAAPGSADAIEASASAYRDRLAVLDDDVEATLAAIPPEHRLLIANHAFLGYFADRYGFEVVGSVIPGGSTVEEPGAGEVAALADAIRRRGVVAVFAEASEPTDLADALAAEAGGLPVVVLSSDALPAGGSYFDLVRTDASLIADALK